MIVKFKRQSSMTLNCIDLRIFTDLACANAQDLAVAVDSVTKPDAEISAKHRGKSLDDWSQLVMTGTAAMASDEDVRRSIANRLS